MSDDREERGVGVRLDDWSIVSIGANLYAAPEAGIKVLRGRVFGHPSYPDGTTVITSDLARIENGMAHTRYGEYLLGAIDAGYALAHPEAQELIQ